MERVRRVGQSQHLFGVGVDDLRPVLVELTEQPADQIGRGQVAAFKLDPREEFGISLDENLGLKIAIDLLAVAAEDIEACLAYGDGKGALAIKQLQVLTVLGGHPFAIRSSRLVVILAQKQLGLEVDLQLFVDAAGMKIQDFSGKQRVRGDIQKATHRRQRKHVLIKEQHFDHTAECRERIPQDGPRQLRPFVIGECRVDQKPQRRPVGPGENREGHRAAKNRQHKVGGVSDEEVLVVAA